MTTTKLNIGDVVGLQYDTGRRIDEAEVVYVGSTCYQLSNGLLYFRSGGRCLQGPFGGRIVPQLVNSQARTTNLRSQVGVKTF